MDDRFLEIKSTLDHLFSLVEKELLSQREEIEHLKKSVEELQHSSLSKPAVPEPPQPKSVPAQESAPSHVFLDDDSFSLDDDTVFEVHDLNDKMGNKKIIGELFSNENTVVDYAIKNNQAWMTDIPGPKVNSVEEALPLNDRLFFIRELFDGDEDQFDLTLERIDETASFKEVVNDMRAAFPEWDESSNDVYRFYMIVRRKFRE